MSRMPPLRADIELDQAILDEARPLIAEALIALMDKQEYFSWCINFHRYMILWKLR